MKITEAMKLVAAAKVRRAQEAVVNGRPFSENLIKVRANSSSTAAPWDTA
jgi:F-type H+-transporting ATPase subunit gamma